MVLGDQQRRAALRGNLLHAPLDFGWKAAAGVGDKIPDGGRRAFADEAPVQIQAAHACAGRELHNRDVGVAVAKTGQIRAVDAFGVGKLHNGPTLRGFVRQA